MGEDAAGGHVHVVPQVVGRGARWPAIGGRCVVAAIEPRPISYRQELSSHSRQIGRMPEVPNWLCPQCLEALRSRGLPDTGFSCESEEDGAMLERMFEQVEGVNCPACGS